MAQLQLGRFLVACALALGIPDVPAPAGEPGCGSRARALEAAREAKRQALAPPEYGKVERFLSWVRDGKIAERLASPGAGWNGLRPLFGTVLPNGGLGIGAQFDALERLGGTTDVSWLYGVSWAGYQRLAAGASLPRLARGRLALDAWIEYRGRPGEEFYGIGPGTYRDDKRDYRTQELEQAVAATFRPRPWLRAGAVAAATRLSVGGDLARDGAAGEADVPGLERQPPFVRGELFAEVDLRDVPGRPRSGGYYRVSLAGWDDRGVDRYGFSRLTADLRQYLPFANGHRVVALRALAVSDDPGAGQRVPFYLSERLGGSTLLRGFVPYRFRDARLLHLSAEYRWEAAWFLDMALFADAGRVYAAGEPYSLDRLEASAGIGARLMGPRGGGLRLDLARSREGLRVVVAGGLPF